MDHSFPVCGNNDSCLASKIEAMMLLPLPLWGADPSPIAAEPPARLRDVRTFTRIVPVLQVVLQVVFPGRES